MAEVKLMESGYKRRHVKICDKCRSKLLSYEIKGWIKCEACGKLYSRTHYFEKVVE